VVKILLVISLFYSSQGTAMSIFFKGKKVEAVLFSPLEGKMTYQGKPAAGATIKLPDYP